MWQATTNGASPATSAGTVQTTSTRSPDATTTPEPPDAGRDADQRRRSRWRTGRRLLRHLPDILHGAVADDGLVHRQPAVDQVQEDGLPGRQIQRIGQERIVLGDQIDLARGSRVARDDRPGRARLTGVAARREEGEQGDHCSGRDTSLPVGMREHGAKSMSACNGTSLPVNVMGAVAIPLSVVRVSLATRRSGSVTSARG